MKGIADRQIGFLAFALVATVAPGLKAGMRKTEYEAPVPKEILQAKDIFISNMGEACNPYSGGPNRAYTEFYDAMKKWGHYEISGQPDGSDLDFEIGLKCSGVSNQFNDGESLSGAMSYGPAYNIQLHLVIRDIKTRMPLWVINEPIEKALFQSSSDNAFDQALNQLVNDVTALVSAPPPQP